MTGIQGLGRTATDLVTQQPTGTAKKGGVFHLATAAKTSANAASTTSSTSTADVGQITGADFLTLLVSELKNQDPTQPTDPQAYVQQLVGVNSLQQLIAINKDLGG